MDTLKWLLPLLLIWPAIKLTQLVSLVRILRGLRLGADTLDHLPLSAAPEWFMEATRPHAEALRARDFAPRFATVRHDPLGPAFDLYALHFSTVDDTLAATIRLHASAAREGAPYLHLHSTLPDGRELVTAGHAEIDIVPPPPALDLQVFPSASADELLARHRERLAAALTAGSSPASLSDEARFERHRALLASAQALLRASDLVHGSPESTAQDGLQLRWHAAFGAARRLMRALPAEAKAAKAAGPAATAHFSENTRTTIALAHYRQMLALQDLRFSWLPKTLLMVGSLVLFMLALGWTMSPGLALVLLAVLAFHEGGHLLGMRLFGYKDTQLLFLPFLGGVAVARDRLVLAPWKHLVILFLGPLPGIFVGVALLLWAPGSPWPEFVREAGYVALGLNIFNLLPILPLDGGQIADVALVSRFPRLRVFFLLLSGLGLGAVGFAAESSLLKFAALFMLFRLPVEWKQAGIVKKLRRELPPRPTEDTVLRRLLPELHRAFSPSLGAAQRLQLVRPLEERVRRPRAGWGDIVLAAAGYVVPLVLCVVLAVGVSLQRGEQEVAEARARAASAGLLEPVASTCAAVADTENAALPLLELDALLVGKWNPALLSAEERERVLALFTEADARPGFAPPAASPAESEAHDAALHGLRAGFDTLALEARDRLRYDDSRAALELVIRGLSVLRHLRQAPDRWSYDQDRDIRGQLLPIAEDALAQGARLSDAQQNTLLAITDESALLAFAHAAQRESRIAATRWFGEIDSGEEAPRSFNLLLHFFVRLSPEYFANQARHYDDTIALDSAFRAIRSGAWTMAKPAPASVATAGVDEENNGAPETWNSVEWELDLLADDIALLRVVRAGLALRQHLAAGLPAPAAGGDIRSPWLTAPTAHPRSMASMTVETRGGFVVLRLARSAEMSELTDDSVEHTWRVPLNLHASP